jgi:hypothetical protein
MESSVVCRVRKLETRCIYRKFYLDQNLPGKVAHMHEQHHKWELAGPHTEHACQQEHAHEATDHESERNN